MVAVKLRARSCDGAYRSAKSRARRFFQHAVKAMPSTQSPHRPIFPERCRASTVPAKTNSYCTYTIFTVGLLERAMHGAACFQPPTEPSSAGARFVFAKGRRLRSSTLLLPTAPGRLKSRTTFGNELKVTLDLPEHIADNVRHFEGQSASIAAAAAGRFNHCWCQAITSRSPLRGGL